MTRSLRITLIALGLSLFAGMITGLEIYSRIVYFCIALISGSWIWSRTALFGLTLSRFQPASRYQVGHYLEEKFEVRNESRLPNCARFDLGGKL